MKNRTVMKQDYATIGHANVPRSTFNLSFGHKTTFDAGYLIPHFIQEVVPGDLHRVTANCFVRLATPINPIMDSIKIEQQFFFVANRLMWDNWQPFMGEQVNPGDSTDFLIPTMEATNTANPNWAEGTVSDYFGLPIKTTIPNGIISALPYRAMNRCWFEWYRDENLQDSPVLNTDDGPDNVSDYPLRRRGKRHDYFTSCLPWPQKGPGVDLPLGETAPVIGGGETTAPKWTNFDGSIELGSLQQENDFNVKTNPGGIYSGDMYLTTDSAESNMIADLSEATNATINDLRQAFQLQKLQERDARGGTRYTELILSHFGVRSSDQRLQRPELLTTASMSVGITQVPQTSGSPGDTDYTPTPQGNLSAYGIAGGSAGFTKAFTEHGYIIGFISARADLTYQTGIDRHWTRSTKYDHYWPALAKIGEQAVKNREIYATGTATDDEIFGYQERWAEMRQNLSKITGLFRSKATASLDAWHLSQDFDATPALNNTFIQDDPPIDRVIAVTDEPHFLLDAYFQHKATRPLPADGAPGYIDHF